MEQATLADIPTDAPTTQVVGTDTSTEDENNDEEAKKSEPESASIVVAPKGTPVDLAIGFAHGQPRFASQFIVVLPPQFHLNVIGNRPNFNLTTMPWGKLPPTKPSIPTEITWFFIGVTSDSVKPLVKIKKTSMTGRSRAGLLAYARFDGTDNGKHKVSYVVESGTHIRKVDIWRARGVTDEVIEAAMEEAAKKCGPTQAAINKQYHDDYNEWMYGRAWMEAGIVAMGILAGGVQFANTGMPAYIRGKCSVPEGQGYTKEIYTRMRLLIHDLSVPTLTNGPPGETSNEPQAPITDDDYDL
jgi:hypothetical protein